LARPQLVGSYPVTTGRPPEAVLARSHLVGSHPVTTGGGPLPGAASRARARVSGEGKG
jgi:hypothetical protein